MEKLKEKLKDIRKERERLNQQWIVFNNRNRAVRKSFEENSLTKNHLTEEEIFELDLEMQLNGRRIDKIQKKLKKNSEKQEQVVDKIFEKSEQGK